MICNRVANFCLYCLCRKTTVRIWILCWFIINDIVVLLLVQICETVMKRGEFFKLTVFDQKKNMWNLRAAVVSGNEPDMVPLLETCNVTVSSYLMKNKEIRILLFHVTSYGKQIRDAAKQNYRWCCAFISLGPDGMGWMSWWNADYVGCPESGVRISEDLQGI